jgi:hypothetical protein
VQFLSIVPNLRSAKFLVVWFYLNAIAAFFIAITLFKLGFAVLEWICDNFHIVLWGIGACFLAYWLYRFIDAHDGWNIVRTVSIVAIGGLFVGFSVWSFVGWIYRTYQSLNRLLRPARKSNQTEAGFQSDLASVTDLASLVGLEVEHLKYGMGKVLQVFDGKLVTLFAKTGEKRLIKSDELRTRRGPPTKARVGA